MPFFETSSGPPPQVRVIQTDSNKKSPVGEADGQKRRSDALFEKEDGEEEEEEDNEDEKDGDELEDGDEQEGEDEGEVEDGEGGRTVGGSGKEL